MRTTEIEWTEHTWNPFVGCSVHSAGCRNCYAMRMAARLDAAGQAAYHGTTKNGAWSGILRRNSERVQAKPRRIPGASMIFVNSMSDFWHAAAEDAISSYLLIREVANLDHRTSFHPERFSCLKPSVPGHNNKICVRNNWINKTALLN